MGYYDEDGEWVEDGQPQQQGADPYGNNMVDPMQMLLMIAQQNAGAPKAYKGTDPYYYTDQASQNAKNMYGLTGVNPIEMAYPLGEKGTVPYTPQADFFRQTTDPDLQAIYSDMDQGASLAQVETGLRSAGNFSDEEIKSYLDSAKQYDKAARTDQIKTQQFNDLQRYNNPLGVEDNPVRQQLLDQYPIDQNPNAYGESNFGDLLVNRSAPKPYKTTEKYTTSKRYYDNSPTGVARPQGASQQRGQWFAREAQRGAGKTPPRSQQNYKVKYGTATRQVTRQPDANMREQDRLNQSYNDRVNAVMKFTSSEFNNKVNSMPRRTPTPGNQNFQARLRAVQALLGR